jgi:hypothetical protein
MATPAFQHVLQQQGLSASERILGSQRENLKHFESRTRTPARRAFVSLLPTALALLLLSHPALSQTPSTLNAVRSLNGSPQTLNLEGLSFSIPNTPSANALEPTTDFDDPGAPDESEEHGLVRRGVTRCFRDQKELYRAPFRRSNFKWDVLVLAGTGALLATDRRAERHLPGGNVDIYTNASNIALGGTAAALGLAWGYGMKTHNEHLRELGSLEIEALVDSFLIYTPMQFIAGRQRPGEGNGYGDFARHHNIDTSFPAGHPMFTMAMASVVAHEYPKPWVEALAYGAGMTVMAGRYLGRDHWGSDILVGSALGYFIGSHIFHSHCDPKFSKACHRAF